MLDSLLSVAIRTIYGTKDEMTLTGAEFFVVLEERDRAGGGLYGGVELTIHI